MNTNKLRPCKVGEELYLFHGFTQISQIVPPSLMRGGHGGGVVAGAYAVLERLLRDIRRPAPCGADWFQSSLPLPTQIREPSRIFIGIIRRSPFLADTAPFRRIMLSWSM